MPMHALSGADGPRPPPRLRPGLTTSPRGSRAPPPRSRARCGGGPEAEEDGPSAQRQRQDQRPRGAKRGRDEPTTTAKHGPAYQSQNLRNRQKLAALRSKYPARVHLQTPPEATTAALLRQARSAARLEDGDVRVSTLATSQEVSVHQWAEIRTWDPGD